LRACARSGAPVAGVHDARSNGEQRRQNEIRDQRARVEASVVHVAALFPYEKREADPPDPIRTSAGERPETTRRCEMRVRQRHEGEH
jgi:hypothetical protein